MPKGQGRREELRSVGWRRLYFMTMRPLLDLLLLT
jgi:hypothetical protein